MTFRHNVYPALKTLVSGANNVRRVNLTKQLFLTDVRISKFVTTSVT